MTAFVGGLQETLFASIVAFWTKPVRWFGTASLWPQQAEEPRHADARVA